MTKVVNETYGHSISGIRRFLINRFLRIYPTYWALLALALSLGLTNSLYIKSSIWTVPYFPVTTLDWIKNVLIIGLNPGLTTPIESNPAALTTAWSLSVELIFYGLISIGFSRSRVVTVAWVICSVIFTGLMIVFEKDFAHRYFPFVAASLPFSMGAVLYWWQPKLPSWSLPFFIAGFLVLLALASNGAISGTLSGMYFALLSSFMIQCNLINATCKNAMLKNMDSILGDLSYPIFLAHLAVGYFVVAILGVTTDTWVLVLGLCLCISLGFLTTNLIERPIRNLRSRVRHSTKEGAPRNLPRPGAD